MSIPLQSLRLKKVAAQDRFVFWDLQLWPCWHVVHCQTFLVEWRPDGIFLLHSNNLGLTWPMNLWSEAPTATTSFIACSKSRDAALTEELRLARSLIKETPIGNYVWGTLSCRFWYSKSIITINLARQYSLIGHVGTLPRLWRKGASSTWLQTWLEVVAFFGQLQSRSLIPKSIHFNSSCQYLLSDHKKTNKSDMRRPETIQRKQP